MVLQLVMFFMLCANFVQQEVNETIKLPKATTAKSLDREQSYLLFINISEQGHLLPVDGDRKPLISPQQIESYLRRRFEFSEKTTPGSGAKTVIIIRAHENATFDAIYRVVASCKRAGFTKLQFRVLMS
jgi:biopolymer transport protein ExbD